MSTPNKDEDIAHLVELANNDVSRRRADTSQAEIRKGSSLGKGWVFAVWAVAAALWGWHLWPTGPRDAQVKAELEALVNEARTAVERHLAEQQTLPDRLPSAVPEAVIRYEVIDRLAQPPTYALVGQIDEISVRWTNAKTTGSAP